MDENPCDGAHCRQVIGYMAVRYACSDARPFECQTDIDGRLQDLRQIVPVRWAIIGKSECEKRFAGILPVHPHEITMFE